MNKENTLKELNSIYDALHDKQNLAMDTGDIQTAEQLAQINQKLQAYIQRKQESFSEKSKKR